MGDLDADIRVFEAYTKIASANDIKDTTWARNAHIPQPRIAELRQILRMVSKEGLTQEEASKRIGRDCTHVKLHKLYRGLCIILGDEIMKHEAEKLYRKEKNPKIRTQLLVDILAILDKHGKDFLMDVERYILRKVAIAEKKEARKAKSR